MKIRVKDSTMVKPAESTPETPLWLSNLDLKFPPNYYVFTVYFFRPNGADDFFDSVKLKDALSRAMVPFYPVAGRLRKDKNGRYEIHCNGEGALFVEAECDGDMDELGDFHPQPDVDLTPFVDYSQEISTFPLFLVQMTRFVCGGVSLATALHHFVADGVAALHFINSWSDVARGLSITLLPFLDRTALSARDPPQSKFDHIEYQPGPRLKTPKQNDVPSESTYSIIKLTKEQLAALKAKCNEGNQGIAYTSYEALTGHVWRCISLSRQLPDDQEMKLNTTVDARSRLKPSLPPSYFGNAVSTTSAFATVGELLSNPVSFSASKVHEVISKMNDEYLRSANDYLEVHPNFNSLVVDLYNFVCPNLAMVSRSRLPFYDADFGWGRPFYIGPGKIVHEGRCYTLPSPTNDGGVLLSTWLPKNETERFKKLLYDF